MPDDTSFLALDGRAIVVSGATSGIGRATAVAASRQGARVALIGRRPAELAETRAMLDGDGHVSVEYDLADHAGVTGMLRDVAAEMGPLSGLVHAAGIHVTAPLRIATAAQTAELLDINVTSALMLAKAFRHPRVRAEDASIVLLSSAVGLVGEAGVSAYAASKAAVASLGKSLGLELARERIRVNSIAAGIVETPLTDRLRAGVGADGWAQITAAHPLGLGTVDDVAHAALYLLSPVSRWVTGSVLVVDGGYTAR
ncbi:SDR family NAD(P)-dependent oxidoreductase [Microbacterium sp. NPDC089696]|uniref:SDR family NAD(P)-dependent oxidoreductase n=1 Tax=Microbacterium sp. NPDC089696 TaxID=3364199 RepID=UPI003825A039